MLQANAQPPSSAPNPPSRNPSDVISLFSDVYTNVPGTDWFPYWFQSTIVTDILVSGNPTKKYENLNYQGVQFSGSVNASSMQYLHMDIWTPNCTAFEVFLINTSPTTVEQKVTLTPTLSGWNSFDIDLDQYTAIALNNIGQFKLVGTPFGTSTVYLDNIYFWKSSNTPTITNFSIPTKFVGNAPFNITTPQSTSPGAFTYTSSNPSVATILGSTITIQGAGTSIITANQAPAGGFTAGSATATFVVSFPPPSTAAPTPPVRSAGNVKSLFSDAYSNIAGTDWFPNWGQSTAVSDIVVAGNNTKKYENLNYQGVQFANPIDASTLTNLHLDIWTPNCAAFDVFLINPGPVEQSVTLTPTLSGWNSFDILLSQFNTLDLSNIIQFKFVGTPAGSSTVYLDNIYFWKAANTPTLSGFSIAPKVLGSADFTINPPTSNNNPATFSYTSSNTNVATIVNGNMIRLEGAGTSIITATQAASGAFGSATISTTLIVSYPPPTTAAPQPPARNAPDVISLFSDAYTNIAGTDWFPNWGQSTTVSDIIVAGNNTKKYENLNYQGVQFANPVNASNMTNLHLDIYTPNCTAFDVFLINPGPVEQSVTLTPTALGWNSYNIPLSQYSNINLSNIIQIKLVGTPFGSSTVFLDNFYFYKNTNAPTISITQPTCAIATGTITVISPVAGLTFSINGTTYTNTTGVFTGVPTGTYNVTSKNSAGTISSPAIAVVNSQPVVSLPPSPITGTKNINQCDTLQTYSVIGVSGYTYLWSVSGVGNYIKSGQGTRSVTLVMKVAGTVTAVAVNACGTKSVGSVLYVIKGAPSSPGVIYQSFTPLILANTNVCQFNQSAFASSGKRDTFRIKTVLNATGYVWEAPKGSIVNKLNDTTITVVFPDTLTLSATSPRYIKVYSVSACDTSAPRSLTLTKVVAATPGVIQKGFLPNIAAVTSVCPLVGGGSETYKIRKVATATYYNWYLNKGTNATLIHVNPFGENDTAVIVTYGAGFTRDSIIVKTINGCTSSSARVLVVSAVLAPPTPTNILSNTGNFNACAGNTIQYTAVAPAPTATQSAIFRYNWTLPASATIMSSNSDSSVITVKYLTTYTGGRLMVKGRSACGTSGAAYTAYLTSPTPNSITSSTGTYNACVGNTIVYTVGLPAPFPSQAVANRYRWTIPANSAITSSNADSSSISVNFKTSFTGGNLTVRGMTSCNIAGTAYTKAITHTGCLSGNRDGNAIVGKISTTISAESKGATIYPNPNNGTFNFRVETGLNEYNTATIQIVDVFGRVVTQFSAGINAGIISKNVSQNKLAAGVYTVKYTIGTVTKSLKMIVQ